jgi:NRPS condensation-like uncharacterized protein
MLHTPVQTTPLNVLDELYLHLDREEEPWSVHVEIRVEGQIDPDRLRSAISAAARRHPLARARLARSRATDVRYRWEIADELEDIDFEEVEPGQLSEARERLLNRTPALDRFGPFAVLLAHDTGGDVIVLNLHHAAGDGLAALRLLASIARAYGDEEDPLPAVDPLEVRNVLGMSAAGSVKERLARTRATLDYLARGVSTPARIVPQGADGGPGYGFEEVAFEPAEVEQLSAHRSGGATVNDVLLGGLAATVKAWNERHGADADSVYLMMPINLRPPDWRLEVVGNFASYVSVRIGSAGLKDLTTAAQAAAENTRRIKQGGVAGLIVELFAAPTILPTALKQRMQDLIPLTGNLVVDTAVLSNLGRIDSVPRLGEAGQVRELWFSPPGRMPLGASFGVATLEGRLFVTLRYRHALLDPEAAAEFVQLYRRTLLGG